MEENSQPRLSQRLPRFVLGALFGSTAAVFVLAALSAARDGVAYWNGVGLLFPAALVTAGISGLWGGMVVAEPKRIHPAHLASSTSRRTLILVGGVSLVIGWWVVGHLALRLLVAFSDRPLQGGLLLSLTALGVLFFVSRGSRLLSHFLSCRYEFSSTKLALLGSAGLVIVLVLGSVWIGTTSGTGHPLSLFGVFRREELDLAPVGLLALLFLSGCGGGVLALTKRFGLPLVGLSLLSVIGGLIGLRSAAAMPFSQALAVERARGLSSIILRGLQVSSDRDGDGVPGSFGGGDCDDLDPEIAPGRIDRPGNGIDEDCSGGDRKVEPADQQPDSKPEEPVEVRLPEDANFLLLSIDTLRFDLGYTGEASRKNLSPHIDRLAKRSTVFERAYALASYTSKSLGPMLLGKYPSETERSFEHFDRFSKNVPFLQERLQAQGVFTLSVQGYWYFFFETYGFERGWDQLDSSAAPKVVAIEGDRTKNGHKVADAFIEKLPELEKLSTPFFAWVHWVDPHAEYVPHPDFDYGSESRERYDGEVSFVDQQVGRVLEALDGVGLSKNTVILLTSDHGEAFGEHGMIRHGFEVWEELVRVPLILHVPGATPRRVAEPRSLIDVAPTVWGVLAPHADQPEMRGKSLLEDALAPQGQDLERRPVLVDMPKGPHNRQRRAFYWGTEKLITSEGRVIGLYDLSEDPGEKNDLAKDESRLSNMRDKMESFLSKLEEVPAR